MADQGVSMTLANDVEMAGAIEIVHAAFAAVDCGEELFRVLERLHDHGAAVYMPGATSRYGDTMPA
jgi:hypothetical protein